MVMQSFSTLNTAWISGVIGSIPGNRKVFI
jgi:hypothetical protein